MKRLLNHLPDWVPVTLLRLLGFQIEYDDADNLSIIVIIAPRWTGESGMKVLYAVRADLSARAAEAGAQFNVDSSCRALIGIWKATQAENEEKVTV